jgi:hypothetical protein
MRRMLWLLLGVMGCEPSPNTDLAGLPGLIVTAGTYSLVDDNADGLRPSHLFVHLGYQDTLFLSQHNGECATIGDVAATYNGVSLAIESAGYYDDEDESCVYPTLTGELELGTMDAGHLELSDASRTIVADYAPGTVAARIATLQSHPSWTFQGGDIGFVTWSPATDLGWSDLEINLMFKTHDAHYLHFEVIDHTETEIRFQFPSTLPVTGDGELYFSLHHGAAWSETGDASSCSGADRCTFHASYTYYHSATLR